MRYALLGLCLLCAGALDARAQQLRTTFGTDVSAGVQTNPYLDPILGEWDPSADLAFGAVTPTGSLTWQSQRWRLQAFARARVYPRQTDRSFPQFGQGVLMARYRWSPSWAVRLQAGGSRYRLAASRDTGWLLPALEWSPTPTTVLVLRGGLSRRVSRTFTPTTRQTSTVVTLSGRTWLTDRLYGTVRMFRSDGQSATTSLQYGGTGVSAEAGYLLSSNLEVTTRLIGERLGFDTGTREGTDYVARLQAGVEWEATSTVTVFAEGGALAGDLSTGTAREGRVAAGVRLRWHRRLIGSDRSEPVSQLCRPVEAGLRFRIEHDGPGRPHLTGDFNGWALPGVPFERVDGDTFEVKLDLPPGRYEYRIHLVNDTRSTASPHWLTLPETASTVDDAFGGTNGVCVVNDDS